MDPYTDAEKAQLQAAFRASAEALPARVEAEPLHKVLAELRRLDDALAASPALPAGGKFSYRAYSSVSWEAFGNYILAPAAAGHRFAVNLDVVEAQGEAKWESTYVLVITAPPDGHVQLDVFPRRGFTGAPEAAPLLEANAALDGVGVALQGLYAELMAAHRAVRVGRYPRLTEAGSGGHLFLPQGPKNFR